MTGAKTKASLPVPDGGLSADQSDGASPEEIAAARHKRVGIKLGAGSECVNEPWKYALRSSGSLVPRLFLEACEFL
jgi:hypothetical protein